MLYVPDFLKSVKYVVDANGHPSAAVVDIVAWKQLLEWLEDEMDLREAQEALTELAAVDHDAERAGWLKWEEVQGELDG